MKSGMKFFLPIFAGILCFLLACFFASNLKTWLFVSIFLSLIIALILEPLPPAFIGVISVVVAVIFKVGAPGSAIKNISAKEVIKWGLSGFSNSVVWLIFCAFMIGIGYLKSGLGKRIALILTSKLGKSTLGLGYAISITDLLLAPFIPSNAARSGGVIYPVLSSIPPMYNSYPDKNQSIIGSYLAYVGLACTCVSSSMFLTGMAPNPLALELISKSGIKVVDWMGWFIAFAPVGIVLFFLTPLLIYFIYPPVVKGDAKIVEFAKNELVKLGDITLKEKIMIFISLLALILWIGAKFFNINPTTTALIVISLMILCKIITWDDFLSNKPAFNVLIWFATLITMASGLKNVGFLNYLSDLSKGLLDGVSSFMSVIILLIIFSLLRYIFASGTAYVIAVCGVFSILATKIVGIDPSFTMTLLVLPMGIMGILTPYGTGHSPIWFASGYIKGSDFWKLGAIFGFIYLIVFIVIGYPWLKFIFPYIM